MTSEKVQQLLNGGEPSVNQRLAVVDLIHL
jgi:hypothetical protein